MNSRWQVDKEAFDILKIQTHIIYLYLLLYELFADVVLNTLSRLHFPVIKIIPIAVSAHAQ